MRYIKTYKLFEDKSNTLSPDHIFLLDTAVKGKWEINSSGEIDIYGDCNFLRSYPFGTARGKIESLFLGMRNGTIPKFGKVTGNFNCSKSVLWTLQGCPTEVGGDFKCHDNPLGSLEGGPTRVGGEYNCSNCDRLTSLKGAPKEVDGNFIAFRNRLKDLEGAPQRVGGEFSVDSNKLTSLKGAPLFVGGLFSCRFNENLVSLEGVPLEPGSLSHFVCDWIDIGGEKWPFGLLLISAGQNLGGQPLISVRGDWSRAQQLANSVIKSPEVFDHYFLENPLDLDLLDDFPEIKAGVLQRTGIKDTSVIARQMRGGLI